MTEDSVDILEEQEQMQKLDETTGDDSNEHNERYGEK